MNSEASAVDTPLQLKETQLRMDEMRVAVLSEMGEYTPRRPNGGSLPFKKRRFLHPIPPVFVEPKDTTSQRRYGRQCLPCVPSLEPSCGNVSGGGSGVASAESDEKIAALALVAAASSGPASQEAKNMHSIVGIQRDPCLMKSNPIVSPVRDVATNITGSILSSPKRLHRPPLASPLPNGCHGRTSRNNSYCRRQPCYNGSKYCKLHYQHYVVAGIRATPTCGLDEAVSKCSVVEGAGAVGAGPIGAGPIGAGAVGAGAVGAGPIGAGAVGAGPIGAGAGAVAGAGRGGTYGPDSPHPLIVAHQDKRFTGCGSETRCQATTTRGRACAYVSVNGTKYCYLHADYDTNPPPRRGSANSNLSGASSGGTGTISHNAVKVSKLTPTSPIPQTSTSLANGAVQTANTANTANSLHTPTLRLQELRENLCGLESAVIRPNHDTLHAVSSAEMLSPEIKTSSSSPPSVTSEESNRQSPLTTFGSVADSKNLADGSCRTNQQQKSPKRTPRHLEKIVETPFPLLSMISTDQWFQKRVVVAAGPLTNRTGRVEKWGNGWVSVRLAGIGLHNRRSFELYLHPNQDEDVRDNNGPMDTSEVNRIHDGHDVSTALTAEGSIGLLRRCVSRETDTTPFHATQRLIELNTLRHAAELTLSNASNVSSDDDVSSRNGTGVMFAACGQEAALKQLPHLPRFRPPIQIGLPSIGPRTNTLADQAAKDEFSAKSKENTPIVAPPQKEQRLPLADSPMSKSTTRSKSEVPLVESLLLAQEGGVHRHNLDLLFGTAALERSRRTVHKPVRYEDKAMLEKKRARQNSAGNEFESTTSDTKRKRLEEYSPRLFHKKLPLHSATGASANGLETPLHSC